MNIMTNIGRDCDAAIDALRAEFGAVLAERIVEAEALDFLWDARLRERYLGQQSRLDVDDEDAPQDLSRIAILSLLDGRCYAAMCLVDGQGTAVELLWKQPFKCREQAELELLRAR